MFQGFQGEVIEEGFALFALVVGFVDLGGDEGLQLLELLHKGVDGLFLILDNFGLLLCRKREDGLVDGMLHMVFGGVEFLLQEGGTKLVLGGF